jgi:hypothetical protein
VKITKWLRMAVPVVFLGTVLSAKDHNDTLTNVPANPKVVGQASPNVLSPELIEVIVGQGSVRLENSSALTSYYGYDNDVLAMQPDFPRMLPAPGTVAEATKTEPDKNTYLILRGQDGADPRYDYGTHFLFQGHEAGVNSQSYITRINLDADGPHRITLMATADTNGKPLPPIDGSVWYPFSNHLLFSSEQGSPNGGIWQATTDVPSKVEDLRGVIGSSAYEGMQADNHGNIIIAEDSSGTAGSAAANLSHAKQPNSFIYRFIPYNTSDLKLGGKLQVLQVISKAHAGQPIAFHAGAADADILSQDTKDLRSYGLVFQTNWVQIHDTAKDGFTSFNANALAKAALGTPFKRPENGQFRPSSNFSEFVFDETGDTDIRTEAGSDFGGFGSLFRLKLMGGNSGFITLLYKGDAIHSGFDNCAFWSADQVVFVEDAGDTLHGQRNALDSAYLFDLNTDYSHGQQPIRIIAEGRDASATIDSGLSGMTGFQNEGDNEITGFHISDGDSSVHGLIGTQAPTPFNHGWRVFYTQQHGDNNTWEILPAGGKGDGEDDD